VIGITVTVDAGSSAGDMDRPTLLAYPDGAWRDSTTSIQRVRIPASSPRCAATTLRAIRPWNSVQVQRRGVEGVAFLTKEPGYLAPRPGRLGCGGRVGGRAVSHVDNIAIVTIPVAHQMGSLGNAQRSSHHHPIPGLATPAQHSRSRWIAAVTPT